MNGAAFQDNYAVERRVAGQIEAEWSDVLLCDFIKAENPAARRLGLAGFLVRPIYYHAAADWVSSTLVGQTYPRCVVDIGAGLGRFLVELVRRCSQIESALYVEPSPTLYGWAERILAEGPGAPIRIPFLKASGRLDGTKVRRPCGWRRAYATRSSSCRDLSMRHR